MTDHLFVPVLPEGLRGPTSHRFLSPHYDDIALSCGGTAALLAEAGPAPEVAIVFGAEPDPASPLSAFAQGMHAGWGLSAGEVIAARRQEETAAAGLLGTSLTFLPFADAIYRDRFYTDASSLFGHPAAAEATLPAGVVVAMGLDTPPDPRVRVYAPLGVGHHVDHRHAAAAGLALARSGWSVWFYEDLPYAIVAGSLETRLAAIGTPLRPIARVAVAATWSAKLAAINAYRSQLESVFGMVGSGSAPGQIAALMRAYATRVGAGTIAERFWVVDDGA